MQENNIFMWQYKEKLEFFTRGYYFLIFFIIVKIYNYTISSNLIKYN